MNNPKQKETNTFKFKESPYYTFYYEACVDLVDAAVNTGYLIDFQYAMDGGMSGGEWEDLHFSADVVIEGDDVEIFNSQIEMLNLQNT